MKVVSIILSVLMVGCGRQNVKSLVTIQPVSVSYLKENFPFENYSKEESLFLIRIGQDTSDLGIDMPFSTRVDTNLRIPLIGELLRLRGDTRICGVPVFHHNVNRSSLSLFQPRRYSIQVEALFYINQIYLGDKFSYFSDSPCLSTSDPSRQQSIQGELIDNAFDCYQIWFYKLKELGWQKAKAMNLMPLDGCSVVWCD